MRKRSAAKSAASSPPVPARDLDDDALVVARVRRQEGAADFVLEPLLLLAQALHLLAGERLHLGVVRFVEEGAGFGDALLRLAIATVQGHDLLQRRALLGERLQPLVVGR